jgi:hypothetical protein
MTIDELAEQIRKDASRVRELEKALHWLTGADEAVAEASASIEVRPNVGGSAYGGYEAATEISSHYASLYPQAIAIVRDICQSELDRIRSRYLPLLMPVSQGSEA